MAMTENPASTSEPAEDELPEQMRVRREKRDRILAEGIDPYPVEVPRTHSLAEVRAAHAGLPVDTATGETVGVTGRVMFLRNTGKLCFASLREGDGTELQAMISLAKVGEDALAAWKSDVDLGDHVFVQGEVITSKRGELSVMADAWRITSKALRPLPTAHKELAEETRIRQRYVDLIMRPRARDVVRTRAGVVRSLRESFHRRGFTEVETPMLQTLHGGAAARPFVTHWSCSCGSRRSSTSSAASSAASRRSSRSTATSGTRAATLRTRRSSRCSSTTRPTPRTTRMR
jgi:lysyl-tRNA synthetase class 2